MLRYFLVVLASMGFIQIAGLWASSSDAQTKIPRVGVLVINSTQAEEVRQFLEPLPRTLSQHGWVAGKNVRFEFRDAGGDPTRMNNPAAELVRERVDVLFPVGPPSVRAAFAATQDIPIVAHDLETDPVAAGYARSYSRPSRNLTGLFLDSPDLAGKWLELLKALVPRLSRVVVLWDATSGPVALDAVSKAGAALGVKLETLKINSSADIDKAPVAFGGHAQALIALPSPMMSHENAHLARLAKKHRLPATSMFAPFADAGGLLAYGPNMAATVEQCAVLIAKILDGAKPGDLPIERPDKFTFVLNLKTAHDLRLTVPNTVLLRADRVIEK